MAFQQLPVCLALLAICLGLSTAETSMDGWKIEKTHIQLTNPHRSQGLLQLSLNGAEVLHVSPFDASSNKFHLTLADKRTIEIEHLETNDKDLSEYRFTWIGAGPSLDSEVCFHYGLKNVSW